MILINGQIAAESEAQALGLSISTVMSECPNVSTSIKLGQFHPGQEEISKSVEIFENIPAESLIPCKAYIKSANTHFEVEIIKVSREMDLELEDGSRVHLVVEDEPIKDTLLRLNAKMISRRNNKVTYVNLDTKELYEGFQRGAFLQKVQRSVIVQKHVPPHVHVMVDAGSGRCYIYNKCSICGATYTCDSSD